MPSSPPLQTESGVRAFFPSERISLAEDSDRFVRDREKPAPPCVWLATADMGYGHRRAVYPLRSLAGGEIIVLGENDDASLLERKLWRRLLAMYAALSKARSIPLIGKPLFGILERFLSIPSFYPIRNLSRSTIQVEILDSFIRRGLCSGMLRRIESNRIPLVTSFYAPAIAADHSGAVEPIYCIVCDADLNRVWVARDPWESRIHYFAPCGKAAQRLQAYGVPRERIFLTGFPLPHELLGGRDLPVLKKNLLARLHRLDPLNRFWSLHARNVEHFLGREEPSSLAPGSPLTITYTVGGAGAQREIGKKIAMSLHERIKRKEVRINLVAGTNAEIGRYFEDVRMELKCSPDEIAVLCADSFDQYYRQFSSALQTTDILWTKPSELSFYCALGIPVVMTPALGPQEEFNRKWLHEIQAGFRQEHPEYAHQWLFDMLHNGRFADAAWSGFLKARKLGLYKIQDVLTGTGMLSPETSPLMR